MGPEIVFDREAILDCLDDPSRKRVQVKGRDYGQSNGS